jgi:2-oxoglutarate ferredoxin oxidoreductase subunit alpha
MIGGPQGLGVETSSHLFCEAVGKSGYYVYGSREYYSNITGRHSHVNVTISDKESYSVSEKVNILATFDAESVFQHFREPLDFIIYSKPLESVGVETIRSLEPDLMLQAKKDLEESGFSPTVAGAIEYAKKNGAKAIAIDYVNDLNKIINTLKIEPHKAERAKNMICMAASYGLLGLEKKHLLNSINSKFGKNPLFVQMNNLAAEAGYAYTKDAYGLKEIKAASERIQINGNPMAAIGKMTGGLRFQSYYPITPASDESTYMEGNQNLETTEGEKQGAVVLQCEDEIAAINAAIGAALTGARSATATSGPGFALMAEGLSWAGMNEVPVVVTYYMRGAPATGLPTRSGQADLKFALNVGHGEFPRIVMASSTHVEVFKDAVNSLNLAEKYQTPVIHIIEKALADAYATLDKDDIQNAVPEIDRGLLETNMENYKRFKVTADGISPRAFLGHARMFYTGDEHNEHGHITEGSENRLNMYEKRMKKLDKADIEIPDDQRVEVVGSGEDVLLTWGTPKGAIIDSLEELKKEEIEMQMIQVKMFSPYPARLMGKLLAGKRRIIAVENNYNAQGAEVLTERTGICATNHILKWTGRPIMKDELIRAIKQIVKDNSKRVVLNGGA